eukprot:5888718-Karenia_brevis.AAC.1
MKTFLKKDICVEDKAYMEKHMQTPMKRSIPQMFVDAAKDIEMPSLSGAKAKYAKIEIDPKALSSPPLPCERGGIKKASARTSATETDVKSYIERALKGCIRTTLRVKTPDDMIKRMWVEVKQSDHREHYEIICKVHQAICNGKICTKEEAIKMKMALLK